MKRVMVGDLTSHSGLNYGERPLLLCRQCGAENSADRGDYWNLPVTHVFRCCGCNMSLVVKRTVYDTVKRAS